MFSRNAFKGAVALAAVVVATAAPASVAGASSAPNVSFSASSDGASAGWTSGRGSAIELTLGTTLDSYAAITIHHANGTVVGTMQEPGFVTDNYNAGSPRFYVSLSDGNSLWGYPPNAGLNGTDFAWTIDNGNTYMSWASVQSAEASATVIGAFVIADADQSAGTVDHIDDLNFAGAAFDS